MPQLERRVVLVTGASSGIGASIAEQLAIAGATVVLTARRTDRLKALEDKLSKLGAHVSTRRLDVCDVQQVAEVVKSVEASLGPVDVLINNAGAMFYELMRKCDLVEWRTMVDVNCNGTINCLGAVLKGMVARGSGHIVNITSDAGRKPFPGLAVYSGTKHFIEALSRAMRAELTGTGIKVTNIQPGDVSTELQTHNTDSEAREMYDISEKIPILKPSDIAAAVMYALTQPPYCAINEILIEPQEGPL